MHKYTIEFPSEVWEKLVKVIGRGNIKDFLIKNILQALSKETTKAFVLAGGRGTAFQPFTESTPAAMLPVGYKPCLQYCLDLLANYGIKDVVLALGHLADQIERFIRLDPVPGMTVDFVREVESLLDTGGALKNAENLLNVGGTFYVMNSDVITSVDLTQMMMEHIRQKKTYNIIGTVFLIDRRDSDMGERVEINPKTKIIEKFGSRKSSWTNGGVYILEPEVFDVIEKKVVSLEKDVFPQLVKENRLYGFIQTPSPYWIHINNLENYGKGWSDFLEGKLEY